MLSLAALIGASCGGKETPPPLPTPPPPATPAPQVERERQELIVTTDGAALRAGPGEDHEQVATLNEGEQVTSTGHIVGWYLLDVDVDSPSGEVWVAAGDVEVFAPTETPTEEPTAEEEEEEEATPSPQQPAGGEGQQPAGTMPSDMMPTGLPGEIPGELPGDLPIP
jgi:hypothetical protein